MKWNELFRRPGPVEPAAWPTDAPQEHARLAVALLQMGAQALNHRPDPDEMVRRFFDALLRTSPHVRACWSWSGPADTLQILPRNVMGPASGYVESLDLRRTHLSERGPSFRMLDDNVPQTADIGRTSLYAPWRRAYAEHGLRSVLALPLRHDETLQRSMLVLYADQPGYFSTLGLPLFDACGALLGALLLQADQRNRLTRLAQQDPLTGLLNRRSVAEQQAAADPLQSSSVLLLDIDHFKQVNDAHGHVAGDEVLKVVSHRLQESTRGADRVARWGGEEFLVWLPATPLAGALQVAEDIRRVIGQAPITLATHEIAITVSIGVAEVHPREDLERAVARADEGLYLAKRGGRNRVVAQGQPDPGGTPPTPPPNAQLLSDPHTPVFDDAVISKQLNGVITHWNPAAERLFGYSAQEALGQNILMLLPTDRAHEEEAILQRLRQGERVENLHTLRLHKDGHVVPVTITVAPIYGVGGTIVGAAKFARRQPG